MSQSLTVGAADPIASGRRATFAIFGVFFIDSAVLGNWIPRIPDVKAALGLSDSMLGLCLLAMPLGSFAGLTVAGRITERLGLKRSCQIGLVAWALLFALPALAGSAPALAAALFVAGTAIAMIEVAMNTEADRIESWRGRRIMSRCHGFWSLGSMVGALLGGLIAQWGVSVSTHFLAVMPLLALAGWSLASRLPDDRTLPAPPAGAEIAMPAGTSPTSVGSIPGVDPRGGGEGGGRLPEVGTATGEGSLFTLPSRAILLLCVMPLGIMVVEGAFIDWSAVFMRSVLDASPLVIGVAYAFFSSVMAATRLGGDAIAARVGDLAVVRWSGVAASLGVGLFALAPSVPIAFAGAALAGAGVAIVYPLAITAAARRPGRSPADNVAALTMVSFSAFLFAPPLIGFLSDAIGLRTALALLAPLAFVTALLAGEVARGGGPRSRTGREAP